MRNFLGFKRLETILQTPRGRFGWVAASLVAYFVALIFLYPVWGLPVGWLGIIPILVGAWFYGIWTGFLFTFSIYLFEVLIIIGLGAGDFREAMQPGMWLGLAIGMLVSLMVGRQGEQSRRDKQQYRASALELEKAQARVDELTGLHDISLAFSCQGDVSQTFKILSDTLAKLIGAGKCLICTHNITSGELVAQVPAYGLDSKLAAKLRWQQSQLEDGWSLSHTPMICANSRAEMPEALLPVANAMEVNCLLAVPLWEGDKRLVGVVFMGDKTGGFSESDGNLLSVVASQVSLVVQNVHLLQTERRLAEQMGVLYSITLAATQADTEDRLIENISQIIGQRLYSDSFGILLLDEATNELYLHPSYRTGPEESRERVPVGMGVVGAVARSGKAIRLDDVSLSPDYLMFYPLTRSELCVPLKVGTKTAGVVNAESKQLNGFTEEDEELLTIIAGQLATAIQRLRTVQAQHYQTLQLERSNSLIRALAQVNARAAIAAEAEGVLNTLGNELGKLGLRCAIALSTGDDENAILRYISLPDRLILGLERAANIKLKDLSIPIAKLSPRPEAPNTAYLVESPDTTLFDWVPELPKDKAKKILKLMGVTSTTSVCYLPLITEGKPMGVLWMWGEGLHESDMPTMSLFASQLAAALQNANLLSEVGRLAITDELTGIFNRRHFFTLAEEKFAQAQKRKTPLSALIVDLDHFKKFNDTYGHVIGDQILRAAAQMMANSLRDSDIIGRYGGEEFSIVLPNTNNSTAIFAAERLLSQVSGVPIETEAGKLSIQLSIGIAGMSKETPTLHALIVRADQALYIAKSAGRNRLAVK